MKIKVKKMDYDEVMALPRPGHRHPKRPNILFRTLLKIASQGDLKDANFCYTLNGMEKLPDEPCMILMNHSSFIDLEIVSSVFYPKPFSIVCTADGFVGKEWLMRQLGCIPTRKFVTDFGLMADIKTALENNKTSVLMYPEASYSFDGTATALPRGLGILLKRLGVPVLMVRTYGAFARDPLYNGLQKRRVDVSAEISVLFSREELGELKSDQMDERLDRAFSFDHFAWQKENNIKITEPFRADGLERILFQCPVCGKTAETEGKGITFTCKACGQSWKLAENGELINEKGLGFAHIPSWYAWERDEVRRELEAGTYLLDTPVRILVMVDYQAIYDVGIGRLRHNNTGFRLEGCDGKLCFTRSPMENYGLYADYYWYEQGDVIAIGDADVMYYCLPEEHIPVAKARLAAEELYKLKKAERKKRVKAI